MEWEEIPEEDRRKIIALSIERTTQRMLLKLGPLMWCSRGMSTDQYEILKVARPMGKGIVKNG